MKIIEVTLDKDDLDDGLTLAIGSKERGMLCYINVFQYEVGGALEISAIGLPASSIRASLGYSAPTLEAIQTNLDRINLTFTRPHELWSEQLAERVRELNQTCECCGRGTNTVVACKECHELICQDCQEVHICDPK